MAHILVVDDEAPIRETLKEILEYEDFEVSLADNGEKAWQLIQKNDFDVILCDVKMPGIDGMELLKWPSTALKKGLMTLSQSHPI